MQKFPKVAIYKSVENTHNKKKTSIKIEDFEETRQNVKQVRANFILKEYFLLIFENINLMYYSSLCWKCGFINLLN